MNLKTYRIILVPKSSITSFPSSDTLFGAICWGIRIIYANSLVKILDEFKKGKPQFVISSSFPLLENSQQQVFFYPKPISKDLTTEEIEEISQKYQNKFGDFKKSKVKIISELKKFKKASFVSQGIFKKIISGGVNEKSLFENYLDGKDFEVKEGIFKTEYLGGKIKLVGKMLLLDEEYKEIFTDAKKPNILKEVSIQKNLIDRISFSTKGEGQIFYSEEYFLSQKLKLYFLIKTDDINYLKPVFKYLEDTGIGRDRFTGKGWFKFGNPEEVRNFLENNNGTTFITLSRYIPKLDEIEKEKMFYELISYSSKVESMFEFKGEDVFKDKVIYVKEGSIFKAKKKQEFYGQIPVVKKINNTEILQNGLAFPVFIKIGEENGM
ncbi:MAG: type III-A CRISPR-associated RAMP protein Csm4 [Candidatus Aenigmatarchaeota archaeon]